MKLTKLLKNSVFTIVTVIFIVFMAACSNPNGGSDNGNDNENNKSLGTEEKNNQSEEISAEEKLLNEKKSRLLNKMLGTYKEDAYYPYEITISKDKIICSKNGSDVDEWEISDLYLPQELDDDNQVLFNPRNYHTKTTVDSERYCYWNGKLLTSAQIQQIKYKSGDFFDSLDKNQVYLYNPSEKIVSEVKIKPALYSKDSDILVFIDKYRPSMTIGYYVIDPEKNEINFIQYDRHRRTYIGTYVTTNQFYYSYRGEWNWSNGGIGNYSHEDQMRFKQYNEATIDFAYLRYGIDESDYHEDVIDEVTSEKKFLRVESEPVDDSTDSDDNNNSNDKSDESEDSLNESGLEKGIWKYQHMKITQEIWFRDGVVTARAVIGTVKDGPRTAAYELNGNKMKITFYQLGYSFSADFEVSVDGDAMKLDGGDNTDAIAFLASFFEYAGKDGCMKLSR